MERRPLVCFLIPVLNEAPNLPRLIASARVLADELCPTYDVRFFVVDDGSTDGTRAAALGLADGLTLTVLRHDENLGPGRAFATGFAHLAEFLGPDDWVVTMEGDNTSRPELLRKMFVRSREGYDVVLASPYLYGGAIEHTTAWRVILSRIANVFVKEVLGLTGIATVSSFYRLYRASTLLHLQRCYGPGIVERAGFECMIELLLKMVYLRVTISEVPMTLDVALRAGKSKLKIVRTILGYFAVWRSSRRWRERARTLAMAVAARAAAPESIR
jgi:dolichol-phosphate mannosyltransferase